MTTTVLGALPLSPIAEAIKKLYGAAKDFNRFIDGHILSMKQSSNATVERSGRVLEGAKFGFGIGYVAPVVIIAAGQFILGHPLNAVTTAASTLAQSNPFAMTCAAIGAVYYGYSALSNGERTIRLQKPSEGLEIGIELVKAVIRFAIDTLKKFISAENIEEFRKWMSDAAEEVGRRLSDVTRKARDRVGEVWRSSIEHASDAVEKLRVGLSKKTSRSR